MHRRQKYFNETAFQYICKVNSENYEKNSKGNAENKKNKSEKAK